MKREGVAEVQERLRFLITSLWWRRTAALILPSLPRLILPALLMAASNIVAVFCDSVLKSGSGIISAEGGALDFQKAISLCLGLLMATFIATAIGLVSFSFWLFELTVLSRAFLFEADKNVPECIIEMKSQKKYLSGVWLFGFLYLLGPVLPMSTLMAFTITGNYRFPTDEEPLFSLPPEVILPANIVVAVLFLISLDYSVILTVLSSTFLLKPKAAASLAFDLVVRHFPEIMILNLAVLAINVGISAPFSVFPAIAPLVPLTKSFEFQIGCQLWLSITSLITWPFTILIFAQFLKPLINRSPKEE